jgi:hypothetical protein
MTERPSTRSILAALAVTLLGVSAGCLGAGPGVSSTPTPTPTPTWTPTATASTDCPPSLTVYELDAEPADTESAVAYDNLTAEQQETFHRARTESIEEFDYAWHDIDVVAYEGRYYRAGILVC